MAVKINFDLGWPVARLNVNQNLLDIWTPPEHDPDGIYKQGAQYICIQGKENLERLRMYLEQYYPGEGESEKG